MVSIFELATPRIVTQDKEQKTFLSRGHVGISRVYPRGDCHNIKILAGQVDMNYISCQLTGVIVVG